MKSNKMQALKGTSVRQKATIAGVIIVVAIVLWQVMGLFHTGGSSAPLPTPTKGPTQMAPQPPMPEPKPATISPTPTLSAADQANLQKMQQAAQAQYIQALNELQMLRLQRDIAQADQAIVSAKLATVTTQKSIVALLEPTPPPIAATGASFGATLTGGPANAAPPPPAQLAPPTLPTVNYTVVSVAQLNGRWSAVLGYQSNLYSVHVGDIMPPDHSKVIAIDKDGVVLRGEDKQKRKISLVPVI